MSVQVLTQAPASFFAGDTVKVRIDNATVPAPTWTVTLSLNGPDFFSKVGVHDGTAHNITLLPADTADLPGGIYSWAITATDGVDRITLETTNVWIKPNPAVEVLTWAKECLQLIRAHIQGRLPAGLSGHTINGNQISKISLKDAVELERYFLARVQAEELEKLNATGEADTAIRIAFARP